MIAASRQEQLDIEAILKVFTPLASIHIASRMRGTTESEVDALLSGTAVKEGKLAGALVWVHSPEEKADPASEGGAAILDRRTHLVRIIEQVKVNRRPGWESDESKLHCGYTCDELKDIVKQALHGQWLGEAMLLHAGSEEYEDAKGGTGWDVSFKIEAQLAQLRKSANPRIAVAASVAQMIITCSSSAADGPIALTVNGTEEEANCGNDVSDLPLYDDGGALTGAQVAANFAAFYSGVFASAATFTVNGADVTVRTVARGAAATLSFSRGGLFDSFSPPPDAQGVDLLATITGAGNPGEVIRYTVDGSTPVSGNAAAETYSAPFATTSGTVLRAASTATGMPLSDLVKLEVP